MNRGEFDISDMIFFKNYLKTQFFNKKYNGVFLSWVTGAGRTHSVCEIINEYCLKNTDKNIHIISPNLVMKRQIIDELERNMNKNLVNIINEIKCEYNNNTIHFNTYYNTYYRGDNDIDLCYVDIGKMSLTTIKLIQYLTHCNVGKYILDSSVYGEAEKNIVKNLNLLTNISSEWHKNKNYIRKKKLKRVLK